MNRGEPRQTRARRIGRPHSTVRARCDTAYGKPPRQHRFGPRSIRQSQGPLGGREERRDAAARYSRSAKSNPYGKHAPQNDRARGHADALRGICPQEPSAPAALNLAGKTFAELARIRTRMAP
jgi:hypothetical protein